MNTIVRTIGGAIGSQVSAGIVAATLALNGEPTEHGFTIAFAAAAIALAIGFVCRAAGPASRARELERRPRRSRLDSPAYLAGTGTGSADAGCRRPGSKRPQTSAPKAKIPADHQNATVYPCTMPLATRSAPPRWLLR